MRKLALLLALAVVAAGTGFAQQKNITIRLGHIRQTNDPTHLAAVKFQDLVQQNSNGRIAVKIFPNSQLGTPPEMFGQMQSGDLEMVYGGIQTLTFIKGGEMFEITAMPFLFTTYDQERKVLNSDWLKPWVQKVEQATKIKIVNMNGQRDPRGLTTKGREVHSVADLKGLKIRVAQSELNLRVWKALGAMPQAIALAELYMALKTGVVDAQENGSVTVKSNSFYEVQEYYIKTDYSRDVETFYAGLDWWNRLAKADQDLVYKASEEAGNYETQLMEQQLADVYAFLKTRMTVIENPDVASMQKAIVDAGVFADRAKNWPPGLIDYVKSVK